MRLLYALGACLPLAACAGTSGLEQELSRMRRDLRGMQKEVSATRQQVERLEGRVTLLSLGQGAVQPAPQTAVKAPVTPKPARVARRPGTQPRRVLPVVRLGANAEIEIARAPRSNRQIDEGALDDGQPPLLIKLGASSNPDRLSVDHSVLKKKDPVLHAETKMSARQHYKLALDTLRDDKDPQAALQLFEEFARVHGHSRLADNALFWGGECLFVLARYQEAISSMQTVLERFPRSAKVPDALVRTGESWLALGNKNKGLQSLRRVVDRHPTSEAARRARARLDIEGGQ
jgi:tol-pal system protein YbgF